MMCPNCAKLAYQYTKKACARCQGEVVVSIAVLCEVCSSTAKNCSVCLKSVQPLQKQTGGCGCGKK